MKLPSSSRDCTDAVVNYLVSSTNRELQEYYANIIITARKFLIKESQQKSVQTKPNSFFKPELLVQKQEKILSFYP